MDKDSQDRFRQYDSEYGFISLRTKKIEDSIVPLGCYYDPVERFRTFEDRLNDSIFIQLEILENEVRKRFKTEVINILYDVYISKNWANNYNLIKVREHVDEYLCKCGDEDFMLQLVIKVLLCECIQDSKKWDNVVNVNYWKEEWYDLMSKDLFPVWLISMGGVVKVLDEPFSRAELQHITNSIMHQLFN